MKFPVRIFPALAIVCACGLILTSCQAFGKKDKKPEKKTIDRQGLQAVAILGGYMFPRSWNEETGVSVARRMYPLEYHGNSSRGKTLIQSKIQIDAGALQRLLTDVQQSTKTFTTDTDTNHPFGKDSHQTLDEKGAKRQLSWWKPGKHKDAKYYFWSTHHPNEPATRIWLQANDDKHNTKLLYIRIESE